ncbi:hypothetical protein HYO13_11095 [Vibrio parahaemolyticus]|nr:hypothetical protein [Vibrio parahaemolyticus]
MKKQLLNSSWSEPKDYTFTISDTQLSQIDEIRKHDETMKGKTAKEIIFESIKKYSLDCLLKHMIKQNEQRQHSSNT